MSLFVSMFWKCPGVSNIWSHVNRMVADLFLILILVCVSLMMINDDINQKLIQQRVIFPGFIMAMKTLICISFV